jgi:hypothetical protein
VPLTHRHIKPGNKEARKDKQIAFHFPALDAKKGMDRWSTGNINEISRNKIVGFAAPKSLNLVKKASELPCCIPNCVRTAKHWHHIKHRRKVGGLERLHVIALARQIPVCQVHHTAIHSGTYDGPSLKKMKGYEVSEKDET